MKKSKLIVNLIAVCLIVAGLIVVITIFSRNHHESTDDAQIEQYISPVNVKVSGYIKEVRFTEHQFVRQGDTLLIIDDKEYAIALKQAEASLMDARSGRKVVKNSLNTVSNSATVYDASIEEAELKVEKLQRDYTRFSALLEKNASTPLVVEQYKTELDMAKARVNALKRQREAAFSSVSEVNQRQENAEAAILRTESYVDMAKLNLSYTVIIAPYDGYLGRRTIEEGQLVSPGQTVTTIIPNASKWIIANFKETQVANLEVGQKVEVVIDAFSNKAFTGHITAISSATGSKYSMIPTDNSAGNFVKIQQRIPVRVDLDGISDEDNIRMAAGMMCNIKVDTKSLCDE